MSKIPEFQEFRPTLESYWRSVILFGRNVASYKFALAESLMELAALGKAHITLEELADPYARAICRHLEQAPRQGTMAGSRFLDDCAAYNRGEITKERLLDTTRQLGFNIVIDAFHNVNGQRLPIAFYEKDYRKKEKGIFLRDELFSLAEGNYSDNLIHENESRWNLVETAWELDISRNLLSTGYDHGKGVLYVQNSHRRKAVTSARHALNGYQKGKCFYCYREITLEEGRPESADVDHFFPHTLKPYFPGRNLDGVWNLVLACPQCNRGPKGKFAAVPALPYLHRLHQRNEYLISSHHPLRESIIQQCGSTETERQGFLQACDLEASALLIHRWETAPQGEEVFQEGP